MYIYQIWELGCHLPSHYLIQTPATLRRSKAATMPTLGPVYEVISGKHGANDTWVDPYKANWNPENSHATRDGCKWKELS